jgi:cell division septum initiation protein DivIVA
MTDELLDQLINVYQQKLTMLKQLQNEMQKLNTRYKQNRESIDTAKTYFLNL